MINNKFSHEELQKIIECVQLLFEKKNHFLTQNTFAFSTIQKYFTNVDSFSMMMKSIILHIIKIPSAFKRYQSFLTICTSILNAHNKKISYLATAHPLNQEELVRIRNHIYSNHPDVGYIHHYCRKQLLRGFQWYNDDIRIEISYQRLAQDMYQATHYKGTTYALLSENTAKHF